MKKNNSNQFPDDYNLSRLISVKAEAFSLFVTPRYKHHYEEEKYEPYSTEILKNFLYPGETFLDIGAHYGYYSVLASKSVKNVSVISVEPVKANYEILKRNIERNKVKLWNGINCAVSDKKGRSSFNVTEASDSAGFYEHPNTKTLQVESVETATIQSIVGKRHVDFIKIDVEGHELETLVDFESIVKKNPSIRMLIEFNPKCLRAGGHNPQDLINRLIELGFKLFFIDDKARCHYQLDTKLHKWSDYMSEADCCNIFCASTNDFFSCTFFSHSSELGGAERSLLDIVTTIRTQKIIPFVVLPARGRLSDELDKFGIGYRVIPYSWWASLGFNVSTLSLSSAGSSVLKGFPFLCKINPDIIFTVTSVIPWGSIVAKLLNKPHIWQINEFGDLDHNLEYFKSLKAVKQTIIENTNKVIFISDAIRKHYLPFSKNNNSEVIYHNISIDASSSSTKSKDIFNSPSSYKLLIIGFIKESKRQDIAIQAAIELLKKGSNIELAIVGPTFENTEYLKKLKSMIPPEIMNKFHFRDFVNDPMNAISESHAVLVCSNSEAYGRVTVEAMYAGKVVIGSNSGALPEVITHNKTGLLFQSGNVADLVVQIELVMNNQQLAKNIATEGQRWAKKRVNSTDRIKRLRQIIIEEVNKFKNQPDSLINQIVSDSIVDLTLEIESQSEQIDAQVKQIESQSEQVEETVKLTSKIHILQNEINMIEYQISRITSAKFYKLWQLLTAKKSIL